VGKGGSVDKIDQDILGYVERYLAERSMCPTLRELAEHTGLSIGSVWARVDQLVKGSYLRKDRHASRSIRPGPRLRR